jgi:hypothetical protein
MPNDFAQVIHGTHRRAGHHRLLEFVGRSIAVRINVMKDHGGSDIDHLGGWHPEIQVANADRATTLRIQELKL